MLVIPLVPNIVLWCIAVAICVWAGAAIDHRLPVIHNIITATITVICLIAIAILTISLLHHIPYPT